MQKDPGSLARPWCDKGDYFSLTITFKGMPGPEWIPCLVAEHKIIGSKEARMILNSPTDFWPLKTNLAKISGSITTIAILKGSFFKNDSDRSTPNILAEAERRGWSDPKPEAACVLRDIMTDNDIKKMGLSKVAVMHKPFGCHVLRLNREGHGNWLDSCYVDPADRQDVFPAGYGFAFEIIEY